MFVSVDIFTLTRVSLSPPRSPSGHRSRMKALTPRIQTSHPALKTARSQLTGEAARDWIRARRTTPLPRPSWTRRKRLSDPGRKECVCTTLSHPCAEKTVCQKITPTYTHTHTHTHTHVCRWRLYKVLWTQHLLPSSWAWASSRLNVPQKKKESNSRDQIKSF